MGADQPGSHNLEQAAPRENVFAGSGQRILQRRAIRLERHGQQREFAGHTFYGQWFSKMDPTMRDVADKGGEVLVSRNTSAVGPAQEFQTPLGYDTAKEGDRFIKIGVGVLKKRDDTRYAFANPYDIVDHGKWSVNRTANAVEFTQELNDPATGYAYRYKKTIRLIDDKPEMAIEHSLENTGKLPIKSVVYNHNFTVFDRLPTGDITVTVPYEIKSTRLPDPAAAVISGKQFAYVKAVEGAERSRRRPAGLRPDRVRSTTFESKIAKQALAFASRVTVRYRTRRCGPLARVVAVEPFIEVAADPGKAFTWKSTYTFYTLPK